MLDNKSVTVPSTQHINAGQHTLVLTLKDNYKQYADLFGGNPITGVITYHFWIKTAIKVNNDFNYQIMTSDIDLVLIGLKTFGGNTDGSPVVQTKAKLYDYGKATPLNINVNCNLIDIKHSYYQSGTVDQDSNDFITNGHHQAVAKKTIINNDGIYHLHLVDLVGNNYDSYLELGKFNWQLKVTFDTNQLQTLATCLHVTLPQTWINQEQKQLAMTWLYNYQKDANDAINHSLQANSKGFNLDITTLKLKEHYQDFLDPINYHDFSTKEAINNNKLNKIITTAANQILQTGLQQLPDNLNVATNNVVDKKTLDSYTNWIANYQFYINHNKNQWFNQVYNIASRGFATKQQMQQINQYLNNLDFSNYLQQITWNPTVGLGTSNDYKQFVELTKLQNNTITWVNQNFKAINQAYQDAIKEAESNINMHGYSLQQILNGKLLPQTKAEINNYVNGKSFRQWLQDVVNSKYHNYQLTIGLGTALPLLILMIATSGIIYWKGKKSKKIGKINDFKSIII